MATLEREVKMDIRALNSLIEQKRLRLEEARQTIQVYKGQRGGFRHNGGRKAAVDLLKLVQSKSQSNEMFLAIANKLALPFVIKLLGDDDAAVRSRLDAAIDMLNRAYGKPRETHEITGKDGAPLFLPSEIIERNEIVLQRSVVSVDGDTKAIHALEAKLAAPPKPLIGRRKDGKDKKATLHRLIQPRAL